MAKTIKKRKRKKNTILAIVVSEDPTRYRDRIVHPEKGKGRKDRPRKKNILKNIDDYTFVLHFLKSKNIIINHSNNDAHLK